MTSREQVLRQVPRHGGQQHRPDADRPASRCRCPTCSASMPSTLGDAVRAGRRACRWACSCVPPIGAGVWVEFEQGDPDYPIWVGCCWGMRRRGAGAGAGRRRRPCPSIVLQTPLQNGIVDQRPARARPAASCSRARPARSLIVNDTGIYIQNGKGASIVMTGPTVDRQQRRADGRLRDARCPVPRFTSAPRCCARTAARRTPTVAEPARRWSAASRSATMAAPYARRRLRVRRRPAATDPCVTAQWVAARDARARRTASRLLLLDSAGDLRADRHAAACRSSTQTARDGDLRRR